MTTEQLIDLCLKPETSEPDFSFFMGLLCTRYVKHTMTAEQVVDFAEWCHSNELAEIFINWMGG